MASGSSYGDYAYEVEVLISNLVVGYTIDNSANDMCCPTCGPYFITNFNNFYRFLAYKLDNWNEGDPLPEICCFNYAGTPETEEEFEAEVREKGYTNPTLCATDFQTDLELLRDRLGEYYFEQLMQYGIAEYGELHEGSSELKVLIQFLDTLGLTQLQYCSILYQIGQIGMVVWCEEGVTKIQGVHQYINAKREFYKRA